VNLEQAEQKFESASREHERLAQQREQVKASIRGIGHDYHFVDLERGVRRNGQLIASDIQGHIEKIRTVAQHEGLSQSCLERIEKAERVVPKMRDLSHERESSEQFVWYGERETQLRCWAMMPSIQANWSQDEVI
jgi:hypothetical protein